PGDPVTDHEQEQEGNREVVFVVDGVKDRQREISSDQEFNPRNPSQTLAVFFRADLVLLRFDAVLGSAREGGLLAHQRFQHGNRIGDGQPDSQGHQQRQVEQRAQPAFRKQFLLRNQIEAGNRERRSQEQGQVDVEHLEPSLVEANYHGGQQQNREHNHQRIAEVGRQVIPGFDFDMSRGVAREYLGEYFLGDLDQPLRPARLLRLE